MKDRTHVGRRKLFAMGASALLLAPSLLRAEPRPTSPTSTLVKVRVPGGSHDLASLHTPAQGLVRLHLKRSALTVDDGEPVLRRVRSALVSQFGPVGGETSKLVDYIWFWNGERWVLHCIGLSSFQLDLGSYGAVVVDVEERVAMR